MKHSLQDFAEENPHVSRGAFQDERPEERNVTSKLCFKTVLRQSSKIPWYTPVQKSGKKKT